MARQKDPVAELVRAVAKRYRLSEEDAAIFTAHLLREVVRAITEGVQITLVSDRVVRAIRDASGGRQILDSQAVQAILGTDLVKEAAQKAVSKRK